MIAALMYHDVTEPGADATSGFPGADAALYKLDHEEFARHLAVIAAARPRLRAVRASDLDAGSSEDELPFLITFDDGGVSAHTVIATMLEARGWRGHFFVTTNRIGTPGFLDPEQIVDLQRRGHVIGSHSHTHPPRISHCAPDELKEEWRRSVGVLGGILGETPTVASVPGGFYSRRVAEAAAAAGVRVLFTSEPTARRHAVAGCRVLGRYTVQRHTSAATVARLAACARAPRLKQALVWNAKKAAKRVGGEGYLRLRRSLLNRAS